MGVVSLMLISCCFFFLHRRKRGERGEVVETIEDVIVRKLTAERIEELKRLIRDTQEKHRLVNLQAVRKVAVISETLL